MSNYIVGIIAESDALALNEGLDDDNKVAFQNEDATEFYIKDPDKYITTLSPTKYVIGNISQSVVDGSLPVTKKKRIYP